MREEQRQKSRKNWTRLELTDDLRMMVEEGMITHEQALAMLVSH